MKKLTVEHKTVYRYHRPVTFGDHQLMFRPRDSHDLRLVSTALFISPSAEIRWMHDVFSNSIAIASFDTAANELLFDSRFTIEHYGIDMPEFVIPAYAQTFPFTYPADVIPDLARTNERHYPDPGGKVAQWAKSFVAGGTIDTADLLLAIARAIRDQFAYESRTEPGTRTPAEMLQTGSGTCRDYALFMMEAVRSLGLAARFVTGYLYDPSLDNGIGEHMTGSGATHAWVQVFLPGAGWVEYDPTNGIVGGSNLIRVAVARDPAQAIPLHGTFIGGPNDFERMDFEVTVTLDGMGLGA